MFLLCCWMLLSLLMIDVFVVLLDVVVIVDD